MTESQVLTRKRFEGLRHTRAYRTFFQEQLEELDGCCRYCGELLYEEIPFEYEYPKWLLDSNPDLPRVGVHRNWRYHVDHIVAIAKGGGNEFGNLTLACRRCNSSKGDRDVAEFLKSIDRY